MHTRTHSHTYTHTHTHTHTYTKVLMRRWIPERARAKGGLGDEEADGVADGNNSDG